MKPVIAVPHWRAPTWERTKNYYDSLLRVGADHAIIDAAVLPSHAAGLLLTGGVDVNPALYHERRGPKTDRPRRERDEQELALLRQALERDIPVLCICRGHQLLNVALGGSLLQDIEGDGHRWLEDGESGWHTVKVGGGGHLAAVYGDGAVIRVNSRHHQGVTPERLGKGFRISALSPDGFVEGIESESHKWVMGVQWHPERPETLPESRALFEAFESACRG